MLETQQISITLIMIYHGEIYFADKEYRYLITFCPKNSVLSKMFYRTFC